MTNNLFAEKDNEFLTIGDLYLKLEQMIEKNPNIAEMPAMIVENIIKKGQIVPTVRHLENDDITLETNMHLNNGILFSQFEKGLVLGYVIKTEE